MEISEIKNEFLKLQKYGFYNNLYLNCYKKLIDSIEDFNTLSEIESEILYSYFEFIHYHIKKSSENIFEEDNFHKELYCLKTFQEFKNMSLNSKSYFYYKFLENPSNINFYALILSKKKLDYKEFEGNISKLQFIEECCNNINKLFEIYSKKDLIDKFNFSEDEIKLLKIIEVIQEIKKLPEEERQTRYVNLYKCCVLEKIDCNEILNVYYENFIGKIRQLYGKDISSNLTKLDSLIENNKLNYIGNKNSVDIYELEEGNFMFLVHGMVEITVNNEIIRRIYKTNPIINNPSLWNLMDKNNGSFIISTSLISQDGLYFYSNSEFIDDFSDVIYGFDELNYKDIRCISNSDGKTPHDVGIDVYSGMNEKMYLANDLINNTFCDFGLYGFDYNEVAFKRYKEDGTVISPNFIICIDKINKKSIEHAKYHKIPILIINTKKYIEKYKKEYQDAKINYTKSSDYNEFLKFLHNLLVKENKLFSFYDKHNKSLAIVKKLKWQINYLNKIIEKNDFEYAFSRKRKYD